MAKKHRVSVALTKKQVCFLDNISKDCKFLRGRKLRRTAILRAFLTVGKALSIDVANIKTEEDLKKQILTAFKKGV